MTTATKAKTIKKDTVTVYGWMARETEKAIQYDSGVSYGKVWLPKSQIKNLKSLDNNGIEFDLPVWLADKHFGVVLFASDEDSSYIRDLHPACKL